jgi:hypothetical protein
MASPGYTERIPRGANLLVPLATDVPLEDQRVER